MKCPLKFEVITKGSWFSRIKYYSQIINNETTLVIYTSKGYDDRKEAYDSIKFIQNNAFNANIYFSCDDE